MSWRRKRSAVGGNATPAVVTDYRGRNGDIGAAQARGIMGALTGLVQGDAIQPGLIRWGEKGGSLANGGLRYSGDLGPLQQFMTIAPGAIGDSAKIRPGFGRGLPTTSTIAGQAPGDMLALLISSSPEQSTSTTDNFLRPSAGVTP
jgi:hypothetical protein